MPTFAAFGAQDQEAIHCIHALRTDASLRQRFQKSPQQTVQTLTSDLAIQQMLLLGGEVFLGDTAFPDRPFQNPFR